MRKSRFTESQIVDILKQGEAGVPIGEILRQHNISKATYFQWRAKYAGAESTYARLAADQSQKKEELRRQAEQDQRTYDAINYRDDQFDLSDAALSVALAMLAVTALTGKRWLLWASLLFAGFGVLMGLAGLFGLHLHPDWLTKLLS